MRKLQVSVLAVLWLLFVGGAPGCKRAGRDHWIREMGRKLPDEFCKEGTYFRECFQVSKEECRRAAKEIAHDCLEKFRSEIPKTLKQPEDGRHWGGKVGACAGSEYDKRMVQKRQATPQCLKILKELQQKQ